MKTIYEKIQDGVYELEDGERRTQSRIAEKRELFMIDVLEEIGIGKDHPKAKKLFEIAWEFGHSSGLNEVLYFAEEMADLLK